MANQSIWSLQGINKPEFTALGNLLALRNGGQVEPSSLLEDNLEEGESEEGSDASSVDTSRAGPISKSGQQRLKKRFLDCLAEFAANRKGGQSVACTAMMEAEESVTIWIARNEGFQDDEKSLFKEDIAILLSKLSRQQDAIDQSSANALWHLMLIYQHDRLEKSYIPNLRLRLKDCKGLLSAEASEDNQLVLGKIRTLHELTFGSAASKLNLVDRHSGLVKEAYDLRMMSAVRKLLCTSVHATPKSRRLWESILVLAKLRNAFEKFNETAIQLPSFGQVTIRLVHHDKANVDGALPGALTLKQTFDLLKVSFNEASVKIVVGQKWSLKKVEQEFTKRQKQNFNVHAEVQMLLFLNKKDEDFGGMLRYFGCSKYSCFMCWHFLQSHGKIKTRGCHGRLFKPWIVPEAADLGPIQCGDMARALIKLQKNLKRELKAGVPKTLQLVKTSTIGEGSLLIQGTESIEQQRKDIEKFWFKQEQTRVADRFRRLAIEETASPSRLTSKSSHDVQERTEKDDYTSECDVCERPTSRRCSTCNKGRYCRPTCEEKMGYYHLLTCGKRPITTADYLYQDIVEDRLPDDEDVRRDFGFDQLPSFADQSNLLGLYKGVWASEILIPEDVVIARDLHRWRVEGTLVANIKRYFYAIPETHRGGYFPWFLKHTNILEQPMTKLEIDEKMRKTWLERAQPYLELGDRAKQLNDLEPEAKQHAYFFLVENLQKASPNPVEMNWHNFGFCTCHDERAEGQLGGMYQKLLQSNEDYFGDGFDKYYPEHLLQRQTATFTEFWQAFESGSLIQLMDAKGLRNERLRFPHLESFLSVPYLGPQPSVWDLKQFIAINDPAGCPPCRPVMVDYGFINCKTFEETCILMEIYKRLLEKADPLVLHDACLAGQLFDFAAKFHKMDEAHRKLMGNPYPLQSYTESS